MVKVNIERTYTGKAEKPLDWDVLLSIFDTIWGKEFRSLPSYPEVIGGVFANWWDKNGIEYQAESIDELGEAYKNFKTAIISIRSPFGTPDCLFEYRPAIFEVFFKVRYSDQTTANRFISIIKKYFPNKLTKSEKVQSLLKPPVEIKESLTRFQDDHPDPLKTSFIMMQFGKTKAHNEISQAIKCELTTFGIKGVRADEKEYHDDLWYNVLTHIYGCGFGIAVFERIEEEFFNPNVALEVGYMFALNKPVCLLKDRTLKALQTDLVGKLYKTFDPQNPFGTIQPEIKQWLHNKNLV